MCVRACVRVHRASLESDPRMVTPCVPCRGQLPPVDIPADIQAKFASGVMAVTGHEVNVIRKGPNGEETSVPCTESYNHHCQS